MNIDIFLNLITLKISNLVNKKRSNIFVKIKIIYTKKMEKEQEMDGRVGKIFVMEKNLRMILGK